ncbi:MAG: hypothetical protein COV35_08870 [Alphaproteobacteria bacterium CG11_big_fil_rev_8_21_14_0_20_39_49]|nr:MAG: hypothetical protein COV35_08870 [Alphaproteobacteria bacterium CG11_big_fil_rev_8_21_14_0_20_39_49]
MKMPNAKCQMPNRIKSYNGFTLIELSIVIVIIGLIVAGVVGGQVLIEQSKARKVITDVENIKTATRAFILEYNAIPGDMQNSAAYWSGVAGGNGDGILTSGAESNRFWVHLSRAGIYPGTFSGVSTNPPTIGVDHPAGAFPGTWYRPHRHSAADTAFGRLKTSLNFNGSNHSWGGAVSGKVANSIDIKIDDGSAFYGILSTSRAYNVPGPDTCTFGNLGYRTTTPIEYNPSDERTNCWMFFWLEDVVF